MATANTNEDKLILGGHEFTSRFILGSGKFSLELVKACIEKAGTQIVTLALRRANEGGLANILDYVPKDVTLLPNTSGARNAEEAVRIARLSRELGCGDFVKIEVIHDSKYLLPDNYETIKATEILATEGFVGYAIHVSGSECSQRSGECRSCLCNATWLSDRFQQRNLYKRIHPDPYRRDRPSDHRGRRNRPPVTGM